MTTIERFRFQFFNTKLPLNNDHLLTTVMPLFLGPEEEFYTSLTVHMHGKRNDLQKMYLRAGCVNTLLWTISNLKFITSRFVLYI